MAWNRNKEDPHSPRLRRAVGRIKGGPSALLVLLVALAVLAVVVVVAVFLSMGRDAARPVEAAPAAKPKAVVAERPAVRPPEPAGEPKKDVVRWRGKEYPMYNEKGGKAVVTGYGVRYLTPRVITNSTESANARIPWEARQFKHRTDQEIAVLLYTEPGTAFVGDYAADERFNEKFLKSLEEPILIEEGDGADVRELKKAVIEARNELKARYDSGEDPAAIIAGAHKELRELGAYKEELAKQLREVARRPEMTEADLDDFVAAANQMLESRGCGKLTMPSFIRRGVRLRARRRLQNTQNNQEERH